MRRIISFIIALLLTTGGAVGTIYLFIFANGWMGWMLVASGLVFTLGVIWLYEDFIDAAPNEGSNHVQRP